MGRYTLHLVGESNYQDSVKRLSAGDPVQLLLSLITLTTHARSEPSM